MWNFGGSSWGTLFAMLLIVALLGVALFAGGRPNDLRGGGSGGWRVWVIGGLIVLGLVFMLYRSVSGLSYCFTNPGVAC